MDDDDWVEPDFLEFLLNLITENDADMSICGADKTEKGISIPMPVFDKIIMNTEEALIELMRRKRYNNGFPTKLFRKSLFDNLKFPETARYDDIHLMYKIISKANKVVSHCIPKYHVYRHDTNNSIATTKYGNITPAYLSEYRSAYRLRTEFLISNFGNLEAMWRYFEQSFLISMVHKVIENNLTDCHSHLEEMQLELSRCREEFINCPWSQDFEKEWMLEHIPAN